METHGLVLLVLKLMIAVNSLTGYAVPGDSPRVEFMPHDVLKAAACGGPCNVQGWYGGSRTIYLDDRLNPEESLQDRGILVHELVHYMQEKGGAFGSVPSCKRWLEREREAYDVQRRWMLANRPHGSALRLVRLPRLHIDCKA